jgi:ribosomal protein L20A (L18A)
VRSKTNRKPIIDDAWVESIRRGVDSPILVRPIKATFEQFLNQPTTMGTPFGIGDTIYELVYGERRWEGAKRAGHKTIPGRVRELTDTEALKIQVRENEDREDYTPLDRADAYSNLHAQFMKDHAGQKGWTDAMCCALIAETCKNDKIKGRTVDQIISLKTKLHEFCRAALRQEEMSQTHAYEIARRAEEEQLELLKWLRKETEHSKGDIPSVRRLKLEIKNMDIRADEKRRQEKLFKDPQPGTSTTKVPTVAEAAIPGAKSIMKEYDAAKSSAQTVAKPALDPQPRRLSAKIEEAEKARRAAEDKKQEKQKLSVEIERQSRLEAVEAIASKVKLDRALLNIIAVDLLKKGDDDIAKYAVRAFGWPGPKLHTSFSYNEIEKIALARVPKLKDSQLAALFAVSLMAEDMFVYAGGRTSPETINAMARKHKVDLGKIRKAVAAKAAKVEPKAKGQKPKAGVHA